MSYCMAITGKYSTEILVSITLNKYARIEVGNMITRPVTLSNIADQT